MAPHRKARPSGTRFAGIRTPVLATAALTSVALLPQSADAAPSADGRPSVEDVEKKVDELYRRAESASERYNGAKEKADRQRGRVAALLDDVARRAQKLGETRDRLGSFAAAQYRAGEAAPDTATFLLADTPQDYFDQTQLMSRLTSRQKEAVDEYATAQAATMRKRQEATENLRSLTDSQQTLRSAKADVQKKLATARALLSELTAQEKARLAALEKEKQEVARRQAEELARQQAAQRQSSSTTTPGSPGSATDSTDSAYATKAAEALAFARAQVGKPYVWGATGPGSYDCSGLTQAAWRAAGVSLPRTTYDQVNVGTTVPLTDARPGDLIFFYDDISHVGLYIGNGMMIHAPKPGAYVREESIYSGGTSIIRSAVRPA
ncbi:NlpC/P60 family protein [Streptomyces sp. NPDC001848]|uniref:C40 family peptidase n=1 Tax=Streptomyces sp. NPDC001848 TaxID=3364618 RepID=UPI0036AB0AB1